MPLTDREIRWLSRRVRLQKALIPSPFLRPNRSVFDNLQCVFVHIPKTAGTSIRAALGQSPDPNPHRYPRLRSHARAFEYRAALGEERWEGYFTFSIVRNPFDLMVSSYFWWLEKAGKYRRTRRTQKKVQAMAGFGEFVRSRLGRENINEFKGDMCDWISLDGKIIVDYVARLETLSDDWLDICDAIGIPKIDLPRKNTTLRGDYRQYYDDDLIELVSKRFRRAFDTFGYRF